MSGPSHIWHRFSLEERRKNLVVALETFAARCREHQVTDILAALRTEALLALSELPEAPVLEEEPTVQLEAPEAEELPELIEGVDYIYADDSWRQWIFRKLDDGLDVIADFVAFLQRELRRRY